MDIMYGDRQTKHGPGVIIELTGEEVVNAVEAWLAARGVRVTGPRTVTINEGLCDMGRVYVDPAGIVVAGEERFSGDGSTIK